MAVQRLKTQLVGGHVEFDGQQVAVDHAGGPHPGPVGARVVVGGGVRLGAGLSGQGGWDAVEVELGAVRQEPVRSKVFVAAKSSLSAWPRAIVLARSQVDWWTSRPTPSASAAAAAAASAAIFQRSERGLGRRLLRCTVVSA